jgi:hypothetical protein
MITIKSIIEENLPEVNTKCKMFGIPLEYFCYHSISSLFATEFESETVFRIWDMIIFEVTQEEG